MKHITHKGILIMSNDQNELLINGKIIANQRDENEYMEESASWVQEYPSILWKTLIEGSIKPDFNGKYDFDSIVNDISIFIDNVKGGI